MARRNGTVAGGEKIKRMQRERYVTHTHTYTYTHTHSLSLSHTHTHTRINMRTHTHTPTHTHTHMRTCIAHTHAQAHMQALSHCPPPLLICEHCRVETDGSHQQWVAKALYTHIHTHTHTYTNCMCVCLFSLPHACVILVLSATRMCVYTHTLSPRKSACTHSERGKGPFLGRKRVLVCCLRVSRLLSLSPVREDRAPLPEERDMFF